MSRFTPVPIAIAGGTTKSKAKSNNNGNTINFTPSIDPTGIEKFILESFWGQKHLPTTDDALAADLDDRGVVNAKEDIIRINGTKLLKITKDLIQTEIADLPILGTERCILATGENFTVIVTDLKDVYIYDINLGTVAEATDLGLINGDITSVSYLNRKFFYTTEDTILVADVGQPDVTAPLNFGNAESNPDDIVRGFTYNGYFYAFGQRTLEMFADVGRGDFVLERINGAIFQFGIASKHGITFTDNAMYCLGDDQKIYRVFGGQHQEVSSHSIVRQIQEIPRIDDASMFSFSYDGYNFIAITFPESKKTFCLNEEYGKDGWFELVAGDYNEDFFVETTYNVGSFLPIFNKRIMFDLENGKLLELDSDTYENDGKPILRERVTGTIDSSILGVKGKKLQAKKIEIMCEKGTGAISGNGEDPKIILDVSYDGGNSWKHLSMLKIGQFGENSIKVEAKLSDKFYSLQLRLRTSDPVYFSIHSAVIDLRIAGR